MMISKMILITNVPDSINQNYERKVENQEREKQSTSVVDWLMQWLEVTGWFNKEFQNK